MITITGEHNDAVVYAENVDENCRNQIKQYLDHPLFAGTKVRIMPDVHFGKGSVVGFTATCNEYVVPSIVGVDIGCGVNAHDLGRGHVPFDKLDRYVRQNIPSGFEVNASISDVLEEVYGRMFGNGIVLDEFKERVSALSEKVSVPVDRAFASLGTLGGGNHFIEIDTDANGGRWLLIHSGSRGFGARIAEYHQKIASRRTGDDSPIKFLFGVTANEYVDDMRTAQLYARVNRALMAFQIACGFFKIAHDKFKEKAIESVHNYIDFEHGIIRKGATNYAFSRELPIQSRYFADPLLIEI
ncbi:MAG: RtcB family protein [Puniceicoccales bacterium]|nr:RtcB family protein [Puniceicoccales bacterium]